MEDFNVGTPTQENIEYAFKNLIFYLSCSCELDFYLNYQAQFKDLLEKVKSVLHLYVNKHNLKNISEDKLQEVKFELMDLNYETQVLNSYYAEWSLVWIEAIISLRISDIKNGGIM